MIAVIFEVEPADGHKEDYLGIAKELRPLLGGIDGFISIERFQSLADPSRLVSLSFWRDEAAVAQWRNTAEHRAAQTSKPGATAFCAIIGCGSRNVVRDYGMDARTDAPKRTRGRSRLSLDSARGALGGRVKPGHGDWSVCARPAITIARVGAGLRDCRADRRLWR